MGQCFNGFVYHTKYDLIDVIPRESFQNTGDNVLSLVRALANAPELYDTKVRVCLDKDAQSCVINNYYFLLGT